MQHGSENNARLRFLEKEEITKLVANCNPPIKPIVMVALNTGMRKGEIMGLKWRHIDFKRGIIHLYNTKNGESYGDFKKSFFTACSNSGIKNLHFHDLRHTFASHMVMGGVDLNTVSCWAISLWP